MAFLLLRILISRRERNFRSLENLLLGTSGTLVPVSKSGTFISCNLCSVCSLPTRSTQICMPLVC